MKSRLFDFISEQLKRPYALIPISFHRGAACDTHELQRLRFELFCEGQLRTLGQFSSSRRCIAQQRLFGSHCLDHGTCGDQDSKNQSSRVPFNLILRGGSDSASVSLSVLHVGSVDIVAEPRVAGPHGSNLSTCARHHFVRIRCSDRATFVHTFWQHICSRSQEFIFPHMIRRDVWFILIGFDAIVVAHACNCCFTIVCCCGFSVPPHLCHFPIG